MSEHPYRSRGPAAPPPSRVPLRQRVRSWWWRRVSTWRDWQRPEVRDAIGGDWHLAPANALLCLDPVGERFDVMSLILRGERVWLPGTASPRVTITDLDDAAMQITVTPTTWTGDPDLRPSPFSVPLA